MKFCTGCQANKPVEQFSRNRTTRDGRQDHCKACYAAYRARNHETIKAAQRAYSTANAEAARAKTRAWAEANPERKRATDAAYLAANKERIRAQQAEWRAANQDVIKARRNAYAAANRETLRARDKAWRKANHGKVLADRALRKARKRQATPSWLTAEHKAIMRGMYEAAVLLSRQEGAPFHVDHIVPINGKTVCGLHVPWNLQILTGLENLKKGNALIG